ncbi:MAG: histidine--tRNA ligase [Clostridia bacterium]|nr:histidine--tRNA ligase [Clostridia bacterium]
MFSKACPKGMRDILPEDVLIRERVLDTIKRMYRGYGYNQIEAPIIENIELLTGKEGGENEKLIFKILKRGEKLVDCKDNELCDLALRYDLTVPLSRYYANNMASLPTPFKAMQIGNVFRAERPQKGRYRQFVQCDIDIIGESSVLAEADLLSATVGTLTELGFKGFRLKLNDRRLLGLIAESCGFCESAVNDVCISLDKADKIGFDGVRAELLENGFDCAVVDEYLCCVNMLITSDSPLDACLKTLGERALAPINSLKFLLEFMSKQNLDCEVVYDPTLVRGMGYYTGTIFEVALSSVPYAVAGGGRYDNLLGKLIGKDVCACGFSIGFERIVNLIKEMNVDCGDRDKCALIVDANIGNAALIEVYKKAADIRAEGKVCSVIKRINNFGLMLNQLKQAGYGALYTVNIDGECKKFVEKS